MAVCLKKLKVNNNNVNIHVDSYKKHFVGCEDERKSKLEINLQKI